MKNKVVIRGTNAQNEKVLIALELQEEANKVLMYTFPKASVTDEFENQLETTWREGKGEVAFPEGHTVLERELSVVEGLLPDDVKADRPDMVTRTQTEWQFAVLSSKLHRAYQQEVAEFKEKIASLDKYDNALWQSLRSFWDKVNEQSRERNLFRRHADALRDDVNGLFNDLKTLRTNVESEFQEASLKVYEAMSTKLAEVEGRIEKGTSKLGAIMDELKAIQSEYRTARMSNVHRNELWTRIDKAFKDAKERRFGPGVNEGNVVDRHNRRLEGLNEAIGRMQETVRRDEEELEFNRKKVASTEGQLEAQIRQAKIKMIEERVSSKRERLAEMQKTRSDVERQIKSAAARESAKSEIAAVTNRAAAAPAAPPTENVPASQSLMDALVNVLGDTVTDVVDTVKAVAEVVSEKAEIAAASALEKANDLVDSMLEEKPDTAAAPESKTSTAEVPAADATPESDPKPDTTGEEKPVSDEAKEA
jgi:chromosome segregation ATPase